MTPHHVVRERERCGLLVIAYPISSAVDEARHVVLATAAQDEVFAHVLAAVKLCQKHKLKSYEYPPPHLLILIMSLIMHRGCFGTTTSTVPLG